MILEKPKIEIQKYDGLKIMKNIEKAMRTCYRSEGSMTEDSYKRLLNTAIISGHESVMEHEKITIKMRCSVGTYKDLTRHRAGTAWSIESTRWCNYSKDRFDNSIHVISPLDSYIDNYEQQDLWLDTMNTIEEAYKKGAELGMKPDQLRTMLPHATAADVVMTANIREWRHILKLRTTKQVHPEIRQLLIPLLLHFKEDMPELFDDIEYDRDFPQEWYANINIIEE